MGLSVTSRRRLTGAVFLCTAVISSAFLCAARSAIAAEQQTYRVTGLELPASIRIDEWGVPHIKAGTHYDAFFVQGFNAARDRLWQIDTWRRRGLGRLAEVLGAGYVAQDRAARLFLYRGDMYREWLAYGSDAKRISQAFTAGINAYVALTREQPALLPPEFQLLGYLPDNWQAEDIVRIRSNGLWRNVDTEVQRARILCTAGAEAAASWKVLEPAWETTIPEGLDPCAVPDNVLDTYFLAKAPVRFDQPERALADAQADAYRSDVGSNNWVVAPNRTSTGRPILADDPHRGHAVPSLRYVAHLTAPGLNVIGAGEPALPGISIGHNERIAFGLTIFPIDQEDLYFYPAEERTTKINEVVHVKGAKPVTVTLEFTRHGPVVYADDKHVWAVRAAWLDAGMAPYFGSVEYMRAQNWREFVAALNRWGAPSENQVYADIDGNIGYKPAGLFPVRKNYDGLLPVPGDGRYEWHGYFDMDVLPEEYNPERGFTGSANSMNLPAGYDINRYRVGFEWSAPWRYKRLWQVLQGQAQHTMMDSTALQRDYHSLLADAVLDRIDGLERFGTAGNLLVTWNRTLDADSAAAAFWAVWYYRHLQPAVAQRTGGAAAPLMDGFDSLSVLSYLENSQDDELLETTLTAAWNDCVALLGADPTGWAWGKLHQIRFKHPLEHLAKAPLAEQMAMPAYPRGGSGNTTNNTFFQPDDFLVRSGASFRMVLDVGRWEAARMTNAPGQSGDPRSPFYDNLLQGWATDQDFPLIWSEKQIRRHTVQEILLQPVASTRPVGMTSTDATR